MNSTAFFGFNRAVRFRSPRIDSAKCDENPRCGSWPLCDERLRIRPIKRRFRSRSTTLWIYSDGVKEPPVNPDHEIELHVRPPKGKKEEPEFFFEPTGLFVQSGDVVRFTTKQDVHTISSYHPNFHYKQRIPWNTPAISSPVVWPDTYFLYQFEQEGVYDLLCLPHEYFGMVVRLVVGEPTGPGARRIQPAKKAASGGPMGMTLSSPGGAAATVLNDRDSYLNTSLRPSKSVGTISNRKTNDSRKAAVKVIGGQLAGI